MTDYRIVFNEETRRYRVERRRWWGWSFLMEAAGEDYATFADFERRELEMLNGAVGRITANLADDE